MQQTPAQTPGAGRLLRVDLSDAAPDFRFVASEPGLPLLDPGGVNYALVRLWLARFAAEPQRQGPNLVAFFATDDAGARLTDIAACQPVRRNELTGALKEEWEALRAKLARAKPATSTERLLRDALRRTADALAAENSPTEPDYCLFKYRRGREPWRLVWCWGYQRADAQPAPAVLCTNPDCNQLFLRRPGGDGRCPGCAGHVERKLASAGGGTRRSRALLLALLLAALVAVFLGSRRHLELSPIAWQGPIGSRITFKVAERSWFWHVEDVGGQAVPLAHDTRVIEFEPHRPIGVVGSAGHTLVSFHFHDRVVDATIDARPADGLTALRVEPVSVRLAVGSTVPVKVMATDPDGHEHELAGGITWEPEDPALVAYREGHVEGLASGETILLAKYTPSAGGVPLEAEAKVNVQAVDFTALAIESRPAKLTVGDSADLLATASDKSGGKWSLDGSSLLSLDVEPASIAKLEADRLVAVSAGKGKVRARLGKLESEVAVEVEPVPVPQQLVVKPADCKLTVGERLHLDVLATDPDALKTVSSDPHVVEVADARELVGRGPGKAEVTLSQGDLRQMVHVQVAEAPVTALRIEPASVVLSIGSTAKVRVVGKLANDGEIDLDPAKLRWSRQPAATAVEFDRQKLSLTALAPTAEPQQLAVEYQDLDAQAEIKVVGDPAQTLVSGDFLAHPPLLTGGGVVATETPITTVAPNASETPVTPGASVAGTAVVAQPAAASQIAVGPYLGSDLSYRDGSLVVADAPAESSVLRRSGLAPGTVITGVNDTALVGLKPDKLNEFFAAHPVVPGDVLEYRDGGGKPARVTLGDRFEAVQDVKLLGVTFSDLSPQQFVPELRVAVREQGEYRIIDAQGQPLGGWKALEAGAAGTLESKKIARTPDDEYELFVERKIGTQTRRFQIPFRLKLEQR